MKHFLLTLSAFLSTILLTASSFNEQPATTLMEIDGTDYYTLIDENISAMRTGGYTGEDPISPIGHKYKNARNQYCSEPVGAIGCVRALGRTCTLGVFCISPKSNLN